VAETRRSFAPSYPSPRNDRSPSSTVRLANNVTTCGLKSLPIARSRAPKLDPTTPAPVSSRGGASDFPDTPRAAKRRFRRQRTTAELFAAAKASDRLGADLETALREAQASNARMAEMLARFSAAATPAAPAVSTTTGQWTTAAPPSSTTPPAAPRAPAAPAPPATTAATSSLFRAPLLASQATAHVPRLPQVLPPRPELFFYPPTQGPLAPPTMDPVSTPSAGL
jgi:hypothetical protein